MNTTSMNSVSMNSVSGVILVGGRSSRMGRDKALLAVDGVPMVLRVANAMRTAGITHVCAVGGGGDAAQAAGLTAIPDRYPGEGPLGGIVSAVAEARTRYVVVSAVDLPFVTEVAVRSLFEAWIDGVDVVLGNDGVRSQPLFCLLDTAAGPRLQAAFDQGVRSPHEGFQQLRLVVAAPVEDGSLDDVDTPDQLDKAISYAVRGKAIGLRSDSMTELDAEVPEIDPEVPEIDIAEFAVRREAGRPVLDVRELDEWQAAHIPGVIHVPLTELVDRVDEVPADGELLVVCAKGGRSMNAATWLRSRGIDATNVDGGTQGWIAAGNPTETGS